MRIRVRRAIGMTDTSDTDLQDTDIDEYLNESYHEIEWKFPFREKEKTGYFDTVAGQRNYEMPAGYQYLTGISIIDLVSGQHTPLDQGTMDEYESLYVDDTIVSSAQDTPTKYVREACFLRMWPTPDKVYRVRISRRIILADIASAAGSTSAIPAVWDEIIVAGAVYRAYYDFGDIVRGKEFKNLQGSLMAGLEPVESKELIDTARAGLEVMGRDY